MDYRRTIEMALIATLSVASATQSRPSGNAAEGQKMDMWFLRETAGIYNPPPDMSVGIRNGYAVASVTRGNSGPIYTAGLFQAPLTPDLEERFNAIASSLVNRDIPEWNTREQPNVLRYAFSHKGVEYQGNYGLSLDDDFNHLPLTNFAAIYSELQKMGTVVSGIRSSFYIARVGCTSKVILNLSNPGSESITVSSPGTWKAGNDQVSDYILVSVRTPKQASHPHYLTGPIGRSPDEPIEIKGGETLSLEFDISAPDDLELDPRDITLGAGSMRLHVLSPQLLKGMIELRVSFRE